MEEDFTSLSTVVTVPPNMESSSLVCVQVDITDDSILERDSESFTRTQYTKLIPELTSAWNYQAKPSETFPSH